jgi:hypothetical protein
VSNPSPPLSSSASQRRFTAFLVRFAGGGEGIGEWRGSEDAGGGCSGGECSGREGMGGEGSDTGGTAWAGVAAANCFVMLPTVGLRRRRRRRRGAACAVRIVAGARSRQDSVIS